MLIHCPEQLDSDINFITPSSNSKEVIGAVLYYYDLETYYCDGVYAPMSMHLLIYDLLLTINNW